MYEQNKIIIQAVNNGWIVIMPVKLDFVHPNQKMIQSIVDAHKQINDNLDPVLSKAQQTTNNKELDNLLQNASRPVIQPDANIHVFTDFAGVLNFLKSEVPHEN